MGATLSLMGGKSGASALLGYVSRHGDLPEDRIYTHDLAARNEDAQRQLEITRKMFNQNKGIQAFHWVQSFDSSLDRNNPADVRLAHEVGSRLVDRIAQEYPNHEIYMATHTDSPSGYIHNHIVFSSVNYETGKKLNSNKTHGYHLQDLNDAVLLQFGMSQPKEKFKDIDFEFHREGKRSNRETIKHMVIAAKNEALNFEVFQAILKEKFNVTVYEFGGGKRIGYNWLQENGEHFAIGARKLGSDFERPALETFFVSQQQTQIQEQDTRPHTTIQSSKKQDLTTPTIGSSVHDAESIRKDNPVSLPSKEQVSPKKEIPTPKSFQPKQTTDFSIQGLKNLAKRIEKEGKEKELAEYEKQQHRAAAQRKYQREHPHIDQDNDLGY